MLPGPTAQQPVPPAWRQPPDSCLEVASPFVCEGGRGVWYVPADTAASPGPSGANCRAWVVVPCAARSERREGGGLVSMVEWLPCCVWVGWGQGTKRRPAVRTRGRMVGVIACGAEPLPE